MTPADEETAGAAANAVRVTFVTSQGHRFPCSAAAGTSLMMVALVNGIDGVLAECGGSLCCGTCHVYVDPAQVGSLEPAGPDEDAMLDLTAAPRLPNSRLSCQVRLSAALDDMIVHLPATQV